MDGGVGIRAVGYAFPAATATLETLSAEGLLRSSPSVLAELGFGAIRRATTETPYELALDAAREALRRAGVGAAEIDVVIYCGVHGPTAFETAPSADRLRTGARTVGRFQYPATRLQHELGLERAQVIGLDGLACTSLMAAVRTARALCLAEGHRRALCVAAELFPADAGREAVFNCTSDGAVAVVVERGFEERRIVSATHVTKGYYWDPSSRPEEMIAAYFPTARHVIERTLAGAGWRAEEVSWVIPHNVSWSSWRILLALSRLEGARVWRENIARDGHTVAGDTFINLADAIGSGAVGRTDRLLLFSFGYGAHWTAMAVEA